MVNEYKKAEKEYKQMEYEYSLDNTKPKPEFSFPYKVPSNKTFSNWRKDCCWDERIADRNYKALETIKDEALDYTRYMYQTNKELHMKAVNFAKGLLNVNNMIMSTLLQCNPITESDKYTLLVYLQTKAGYLYTNVANHQFHSTDVINSNLITLDELREFKEQIQSHHNLYNTSEDYYEETMKLIEDGFKFFEGDED